MRALRARVQVVFPSPPARRQLCIRSRVPRRLRTTGIQPEIHKADVLLALRSVTVVTKIRHPSECMSMRRDVRRTRGVFCGHDENPGKTRVITIRRCRDSVSYIF